MGAAFYETKGYFKGTREELATLTKILSNYTGKTEGVYFLKCSFDEQNGNEIQFSASGPYGKYDRIMDVPVFREMAEAAPTAFYDIEVSGNTDFTEEEIRFQLSDGKLRIEINSSDSEDEDQAYREYIIGKMPYEHFLEIYQINPDSFEEDSYEDLITDLIDEADYDSNPCDIEFTGFSDLLEGYGGETMLNEETYPEAVARVDCLGILSSYEYREEQETSVRESYEYDPATRKWIE